MSVSKDNAFSRQKFLFGKTKSFTDTNPWGGGVGEDVLQGKVTVNSKVYLFLIMLGGLSSVLSKKLAFPY